jgi:cation transport ATPase
MGAYRVLFRLRSFHRGDLLTDKRSRLAITSRALFLFTLGAHRIAQSRAAPGLLMIAALAARFDIAESAWQGLRSGHIGIAFLVAVATLSAQATDEHCKAVAPPLPSCSCPTSKPPRFPRLFFLKSQ